MRKPEPDVNFALVPAVRLRRLAAADADAAPYDFAEFQRRSNLTAVRPGSLSSARGAALAAAVSGLLLGAVLWQQLTLAPGAAPSGADDTAALAAQRADTEADDSASPALVRAGSLVARSELEERIAFFDAVLSESRVGSAQPERLAALEQGRSELVDSLQRVHYAEQLMAP
jgi:hypothetical protein